MRRQGPDVRGLQLVHTRPDGFLHAPRRVLRNDLFIQIVVLPLIMLWDLGTSHAVLARGAAPVVGLRIPSLGFAGISA